MILSWTGSIPNTVLNGSDEAVCWHASSNIELAILANWKAVMCYEYYVCVCVCLCCWRANYV